MRTAIVFSAIIVAYAISAEATDKFVRDVGSAFVVLIFVFFAMDVLDFGKNRT